MSDGWHPISDDGQRAVTRSGGGYSLYQADGPIDPAASTRRFRWAGSVPDYGYAEAWLKDGKIAGEFIELDVTPKKVKVGAP